MDLRERQFFRDQFRVARAAALADAERFHDIVFAIERLGSFRTEKKNGLGNYQESICALANESPLAVDVPREQPAFHAPIQSTYRAMKDARNSALHTGAFARHLTTTAIEIAIILEDALSSTMTELQDFMVKGPTVAEIWQPISFIRQQMLAHSFSFLPVRVVQDGRGEWRVIADFQVAQYLGACSRSKRTRRLARRLQEVISSGEITPLEAPIFGPKTPVADAVKSARMLPILVTEVDGSHLLGLVTAFDLL